MSDPKVTDDGKTADDALAAEYADDFAEAERIYRELGEEERAHSAHIVGLPFDDE